MWPRTFMVRSWFDLVCGCMVWYRKVTLSGFCVHCILYNKIHLADFMFLLYIAQSRQIARLFLQSSELGPPAPSTAGECVPPSLVLGGGHTCLRVRGVTLRSWCDRVKWPDGVKRISIKWRWPLKVTLKAITRCQEIFCWCCDGVPLKWNKKKLGLQFVITDQMSLLSPLNSYDRSIPLIWWYKTIILRDLDFFEDQHTEVSLSFLCMFYCHAVEKLNNYLLFL